VCRIVGERAGLASANKHLGVIALKGPPPDFASAARLFEESLALRRELGDQDGTASCLNDLAVLALDEADYTRARPLLEESMSICRAADNPYGLSFVLNNLSILELNEGAYSRVPELLRESLLLARQLGSREKIGCALTGLASLAAVRAEPLLAARLFGAAEALRESIGVPMAPAERAIHERFFARARTRVQIVEWDAAFALGRAESLDELIDNTLSAL
jgi:hypothetical protein